MLVSLLSSWQFIVVLVALELGNILWNIYIVLLGPDGILYTLYLKLNSLVLLFYYLIICNFVEERALNVDVTTTLPSQFCPMALSKALKLVPPSAANGAYNFNTSLKNLTPSFLRNVFVYRQKRKESDKGEVKGLAVLARSMQVLVRKIGLETTGTRNRRAGMSVL